jgi:hypothetical protein
MDFISADADYAAQLKALIEQRHCLPLGLLVGFFLADELLNLMC